MSPEEMLQRAETLAQHWMSETLKGDIEIERLKAENGREVYALEAEIERLTAANGRDVDELYSEVVALEAEVKRITAANQAWLDKWEQLECEWCGTSNRMRDGDQ